jgi:hypothetical protein
VKTVWLGQAQPPSMCINARLPPCAWSASPISGGIELLGFLLALSHGCRHPVDRIFACLCSPILCGVTLWLAIETGLNLRTLADWSGRGFRGLVSSLSELHYSLRWPLGFFTWPGWLGDV